MSKRDLQDGWGLFGDLLRETSWPVRIGLVLGLGAAAVYWVRLVASGSLALEDTPKKFTVVLIVFSGFGLLLAGGLGGLLLGSMLDVLCRPFARGEDGEEEEEDPPRRTRGPRRNLYED